MVRLMRLFKNNKKAAYDLGRKGIYFTVAILVIFIIFVYVSNSIQSYQFANIAHLNKVIDLTHIRFIEKCISKDDGGRVHIGELAKLKLNIDDIKKCVESEESLKGRNFKITIKGQDPVQTKDNPYIEYDNYERYFTFQQQTKIVGIGIEKVEIYV